MDDEFHAAQAPPNEVGIGNRADVGGKGRIKKIEAYDFVSALPQGPDESLTEVPGASGHEHAHSVWAPFPAAQRITAGLQADRA